MMTKREAIEKYGGSHVNKLARAIDANDVSLLLYTYMLADDDSQAQYENEFPRIREAAGIVLGWPLTIKMGLLTAFPAMHNLDEEVDAPVTFASGGYREEAPDA